MTFGNPFEAPPIGFGSITSYQYKIPVGWKVNGGSPSDGNTWITANNSVTITSDLSNGDLSNIQIRPVNSCNENLVSKHIFNIPISRPAPNLQVSPAQGAICALNGTANFSLTGMPPGSSVSWVVTNNGANAQIIGCSTCPTVQIKRVTTANVLATLTATVTHCTFTYQKNVTVLLGTGTNSINYTIKEIFCNIGKPYFNGAVQPFPFATNYEWYSKDMSNPSNPFILRQSENSNTADFPLGNNKGNRYFTIRVIATNACGSVTSIDAEGLIWAPLCEGGGALMVQVSPNPITSITQVSVVDETGKLSTVLGDNIYAVQVWNKSSELKKEFKYAKGSKTVQIDLSSLPPDIYILRIFDGSEWVSKQVVKK